MPLLQMVVFPGNIYLCHLEMVDYATSGMPLLWHADNCLGKDWLIRI